jgi:hypothetical protein
MDMHFPLSQAILCVWKGVQNTAGRNLESEKKMVKYHRAAVDIGIIFICSELSILHLWRIGTVTAFGKCNFDCL